MLESCAFASQKLHFFPVVVEQLESRFGVTLYEGCDNLFQLTSMALTLFLMAEGPDSSPSPS